MTVRCIYCASICNLKTYIFTHTHTRLTALCPGLPRWASTRKVKPIWILLKQQTVSGSGISWAISKTAPCSRQTTTPAPHHSVYSVFLQAGCPSCRPTYIFNKNKKVNTCIFKLSTASNDRQNLSDIWVLRHTLLWHLANTHASDTSLCAWLLWTLLHYSTSKLYIVA